MELKYSVKDICYITGVSRRTLHFYDKEGILVPDKEANGYRKYSQSDLERLQFIFFLKNLGLSLKEIKHVISITKTEQKEYLKKYQKQLYEQQYQLHTTIDNLHRFLNGDSLLEFNSFSQKLTSLNDQYNKEARIKYGHTEQYKEYEANLASMNEEELQNFNKNITHRVESIYQNLANWSDDSPDSDRIQREIVKLHNCFNKTMSCSLDLFLYIAEQFVADNRFQNYFIKFGYNELPTFIYKAVQYYCQEKSTD